MKETSLGAETYPSTTETSAEESAIPAVATGAAEPFSIAERPKTAESTKVPAPVTAEPAKAPATITAPITSPEPLIIPSETAEAAHTKRPYEKPIFSNDEVKPPKMARTEEEAAAADKEKALAGAGPASTAAYTAPEPVPAPTLAAEAPKKVESAVPTTEAPKKVESATPAAPAAPATEAPKKVESASKANPDAVAAANAAINTSKADKSASAAPAESELKKPEAAVKRGQEPEAPQTETAQEQSAQETKADELKTSEQTAEQAAEKKKGGFFARLKRMFK